MKYHKLVRDNIPEIIKESGDTPITHIATDKEYREKLHEKLREEVEELLKEPSEEEVADVLEVLVAMQELYGFSAEAITKLQQEKAVTRGRFTKQIILEETR